MRAYTLISPLVKPFMIDMLRLCFHWCSAFPCSPHAQLLLLPPRHLFQTLRQLVASALLPLLSSALLLRSPCSASSWHQACLSWSIRQKRPTRKTPPTSEAATITTTASSSSSSQSHPVFRSQSSTEWRWRSTNCGCKQESSHISGSGGCTRFKHIVSMHNSLIPFAHGTKKRNFAKSIEILAILTNPQSWRTLSQF